MCLYIYILYIYIYIHIQFFNIHKHVHAHSTPKVNLRCNASFESIATFIAFHLDRQKITGCVSRGGIADRDAPNCQESTKYWCNLTTEELTVDDHTTSVAVQGQIRANDALAALSVPSSSVGTAVSIPDPLAMVRQQLASTAAAAPSEAAPATPVSSVAPRAAGYLAIILTGAVTMNPCLLQCCNMSGPKERQRPKRRLTRRLKEFRLCLMWRWLEKQWNRKLVWLVWDPFCCFQQGLSAALHIIWHVSVLCFFRSGSEERAHQPGIFEAGPS